MAIIICTISVFIFYSLLIIYYWLSWRSSSDFTAADRRNETNISVIVPARNEEKNIAQLLKALEQQAYPKNLFEVIVVDDHSTDQTAEIVRQFPEARLLQLKDNDINSYKKKAIEKGIDAARNPFIVTTDADCIP